jgi:hypothetical protein
LSFDAASAEKTGIHVKTLHRIFGPKANSTAANLFNIIASLQEHEGMRLQVVALAFGRTQLWSSRGDRFLREQGHSCL